MAASDEPQARAELAIEEVRLRPVRVPLARGLATRVGIFSEWQFVLIDVRTDQGITGSAYLNAPKGIRALVGLLTEMGEMLRGDAVAPAANYAKARSVGALLGYEGLTMAAVSGLDMALWDALAKAAGLPLVRLLGGTPGSVAAYNSNGLGLLPPDQVAEEARALVAQGDFGAIKIRVGRSSLADDVAAVRNVRAAVGDEVTLFCDFNQCLDFGEALRRCHALDGEGLAWIEEPMAYDDLAGHARLTREIRTPIQIGENFYGPHGLADALKAEASDYLMPDLGRIGGVTGWLRAAALTDAARIPMSTHLYPEVSCHLMPVTPTAHWLEWTDWAHPILARPFEIAGGRIVTPDVPGSGLAWNEDAVTRYSLELS